MGGKRILAGLPCFMLETQNGVVVDPERGFEVRLTQGHMGTHVFKIVGSEWDVQFTAERHLGHSPPVWVIRISGSRPLAPIQGDALHALIEEIVALQAADLLNRTVADVIATFRAPSSLAALYVQRPYSPPALSPRKLTPAVVTILILAFYLIHLRVNGS
jgi:hypothetical protein